MTQRDSHELSPEEEAARRAVRGLGRPEAPAAFRERLRESFTSGDIRGSERRRRPRFARMVVPLAAAAVLFLFVIGRHQEPGPELLGVHIGEGIEVDGERFTAGERDALERALRPGAEIRLSDDAEIEFRWGSALLFQSGPGAQFETPRSTTEFEKSTLLARLTKGELRFMTGPGFAGMELLVETPEGMARITGTMVSVYRDDTGTCICVFEGTARIGTDEADLQPVPAGERKVMPIDGPAFVDAIAPPHEEELARFRDQWALRFRARDGRSD